MINLLGFPIVFVILIFSIIVAGGSIFAFFSLTSILIVIGGSFAAAIIVYGLSSLKQTFFLARLAFRPNKSNDLETISSLIDYAAKARRDGVLSLDNAIEEVKNPFLKKGLQFVVDGLDGELLKEMMQTNIDSLDERHTSNRSIFKFLEAVSPAFGLMGTIIGLVLMFGSLASADVGLIAQGLATAIITTLYGSFLSNVVFNTIYRRLEFITAEEIFFKRIIIEALISIQNGDSPRIIEEKITSFYSEKKGKEITEIIKGQE